MHAFLYYGVCLMEQMCWIVGEYPRGANTILNMLGANVVQFDRRTEALLREEIASLMS